MRAKAISLILLGFLLCLQGCGQTATNQEKQNINIPTPAANATSAVQEGYNLNEVLVGHWRLKADSLVFDDVYQADGEFSSNTKNTENGTQVYIEGKWEVVGQTILRRHILDYSPKELVWLDANAQRHLGPILLPEWDSIELNVLDSDRIKTPTGHIAYRVKDE